jgi:uncharacterized hydrophobic protein (TIGR00271 family)
VIHARIISPKHRSEQVLELLKGNESVCNVILFEDAAKAPEGDVILADIAREDASVVLSDLKELDLQDQGSISLDEIDAQLSKLADHAEKHARGTPSDAVIWEEVEAKTSESTELSAAFMTFIVVAALIASVGIFLDSPILIVGAMVVGPEFGPVAGLCVALATRRPDVAWRSAIPLAAGFPVAIGAVFLATLAFKATGVTPKEFSAEDHGLANVIANPDFFAFFVAACAGVAGMLSLSTAKSGALIGVLISVTTIPAAANIGLAAAYADWPASLGSMGQLAINLGAILLSGTATLTVQRVLYLRRRRAHLADPERRRGGLPVGRSRRSPT